ncbi:MAG: hypothetical protein EPN99_16155 [Frankiales bacterium]|nr:MAG: hypothetical protein EPN99_16155 [Frankiales bacterium]
MSGWTGGGPDPDELHTLDLAQLTPPDDDLPPWIPPSERPPGTDWHWLNEGPVDRERLVDIGS